nr:putative phosphodiester glycosidase [uncultured bacterium]
MIAFVCSLLGTCSQGACQVIEFKSVSNTVCSYEVSTIRTGLFLNDPQGQPYRSLSRLENRLENRLDKPALMLMNGGMYHSDLGAVGLYIENGRESKGISTKGGWGNFHLLPNGVFWGKDGKLDVTETKTFIWKQIKPDFATQSGPMLVINGKLHPRFLQDSDSLKIRNGVGVSNDGKWVHFAISQSAVTFWDFGKLFQEKLKTPNALFLDGTVSAIKAEGFSQGGWRDLGPMIGVFER